MNPGYNIESPGGEGTPATATPSAPATGSAFRAELVALCRKHRVRIEDADQYDGEERCVGTAYYFTSGDSMRMELSDVQSEVNAPQPPNTQPSGGTNHHE